MQSVHPEAKALMSFHGDAVLGTVVRRHGESKVEEQVSVYKQ